MLQPFDIVVAEAMQSIDGDEGVLIDGVAVVEIAQHQ
jgi:hypothetical protein